MLRPHLLRLVRALDGKDPGTAVATVERILPLLELEPPPVKRIFTTTVIMHWYRRNLNPKPLIEALRRDRRDLDWQRETQRLIALTLERAGAWDEALGFWDGYVTAATRAVSRVCVADCTSIWSPRTARGVNTVTTLARTCAKPPSTKNRCVSSPRRMRSSP